MAFPYAALISLGANIYQAQKGYESNKETNQINAASVASSNRLNAQLQREANQLAIQEAQKNREYYSPENMMNMLERAGLNRNLVAQQAVTGAGSSTPSIGAASAAPAVANPFDASRYNNPASAAIDTALKVAQVNKTNAETANTSKDTELKGTQIRLNETTSLNVSEDTRLKGYEIQQIKANCNYLSAEIDKLRSDILKNESDISKNTAETGKINEETTSLKIDNMFREERNQAEIKNINALTKKLVSEAHLNYTQVNLNKINYDFLSKTLIARIAGVNYQNEKMSAEVQLMNEQIVSEILRQNGIILDNDTKTVEFNLNKWNSDFYFNLMRNPFYQIAKLVGFISRELPTVYPIHVAPNSSKVLE